MDKQKTRALDRLILLHRLRIIATTLIVPTVLIAIIVFLIHANSTTDTETVTGTVLSWSRAQSELGADTYIIWVTLADGSKVTVTAGKDGRSPVKGEQIEIEKAITTFGGVRYRWHRK